jgi:acyl carrier protein
VDRKALPAPESAAASASYVPPRDAVEEAVAGVWSEVLGVARVGVHDSFFDLGGHSLLATQVLSRLRQHFSVEIPLRRLFEGPTVATLATSIKEARGLATEGRIGARNVETGADILSQLDGLSEDEVDSMLRSILREELAVEEI